MHPLILCPLEIEKKESTQTRVLATACNETTRQDGECNQNAYAEQLWAPN